MRELRKGGLASPITGQQGRKPQDAVHSALNGHREGRDGRAGEGRHTAASTRFIQPSASSATQIASIATRHIHLAPPRTELIAFPPCHF